MIRPHPCPRKHRWDVAERTLWTILEGILAGGVVWAQDLPLWLMFPIMGAAALAKSYIAGKIGHPLTGSTLPSAKDPASPHASEPPR